MHELGLVIDMVEIVERYAAQNRIKKVRKVVLTVGEGFSVVPHLMYNVYNKASHGTILEGSALELKLVDAAAECKGCGGRFNPLREKGVCPSCGDEDFTVLAGKEFEITSIEV